MEELGSIVGFLENKTVLITGSTGFVSKVVLVEKILRTQPNVKKLYLLLRATDSAGATRRLYDEILGKELFSVLRERWGTDLSSLVTEKVVIPVPGDIAYEDLGVKDEELKNQMWNEIDLVVNLAATINFDERYDVALGINTLGPKHILDFAKRCVNLKVFVHVSTAYVCGEREGIIEEAPFEMGETLNGTFTLDIDLELTVTKEKLLQLKEENLSQDAITSAMKEFGDERARKFGWPNTYVFTKSMGEMLLGQLRGDIPLAIVRPTIVTSTYKEPFPGWTEGSRAMDSIAIAYGKGRISSFLANPKTVLDLIPADMVVNSILVAMAVHANRPGHTVYQVGSSKRNPLNISSTFEKIHRYFSQTPWIGRDGKPVRVSRVKLWESMDNFKKYMAIRYILPLKVLELANNALCHYFEGTTVKAKRKLYVVMRLIDLYRAYLLFQGVKTKNGSKEEQGSSRHVTFSVRPHMHRLGRLLSEHPFPWCSQACFQIVNKLRI